MGELPQYVDSDKVTAVLEHGVLTITLPKRKEAQTRESRSSPVDGIEVRREIRHAWVRAAESRSWTSAEPLIVKDNFFEHIF